MSGGSMNYLYSRMSWEADFTKDTPERKAFGDHLELVIKALHDIEWVDSCDYRPGDENAAIRACLAGGIKMRAAAEEARRVLSMPLLMKGDAPVAKALTMLDEALGKSTPQRSGEDMTDRVAGYCEPWIEGKLRERLLAYKKRYPAFKMERVMEDVLTWPPKSQRWAPYMKDKDIKALNRTYQRIKSLSSLAMNEHL